MYSSLNFVIGAPSRVGPTKKAPPLLRVVRPQCLRRRRRRRQLVLTLAIRAAVSQGAYLQQALRRVLDLQRRVIEREAFVEHRFELAPDRVAVLAPADEHVGGESRKAARDLPDVEIVDARHTWMGRD